MMQINRAGSQLNMVSSKDKDFLPTYRLLQRYCREAVFSCINRERQALIEQITLSKGSFTTPVPDMQRFLQLLHKPAQFSPANDAVEVDSRKFTSA